MASSLHNHAPVPTETEILFNPNTEKGLENTHMGEMRLQLIQFDVNGKTNAAHKSFFCYEWFGLLAPGRFDVLQYHFLYLLSPALCIIISGGGSLNKIGVRCFGVVRLGVIVNVVGEVKVLPKRQQLEITILLNATAINCMCYLLYRCCSCHDPYSTSIESNGIIFVWSILFCCCWLPNICANCQKCHVNVPAVTEIQPNLHLTITQPHSHVETQMAWQ